MRSYKLIVSLAALNDLDNVVAYIASIYRLESGLKYKERIIEQVKRLSYCADCFPISRKRMIKRIHPEGRRILIMNRKWCVIYHISDGYVLVDRFVPSKSVY